ncbi:succinyl-diaminopimelate desuccinylase [Bartonella sp. TP]|uniref:succinyl-diaminopimelate desuccinylase n=1 Tax=Bartonella sp. TP TaxID=3057550 RepID=UPI0025B1CB99|nr:succinyl-diaminopimelate desuccinylase [Bartonella sp. TP]WJW80466.1 succinyl-diaminopimelate desuccinylase [Bartonella sp. TP]
MSNKITIEELKNPLFVLQELLRCPSVTPIEAGAQQFIAECLEPLGFTIQHLPFEAVANLYASRPGGKGRHLLFSGHSDVVSPGAPASWSHAPFSGIIEGGRIYGRGAQDMKGAIACFISALARAGEIDATISLAITADEEGPALDGTVKLLQHVAQQGEKWDFALVGEPTCGEQFGDTIKIGRRGSLNGVLHVQGVGGHVAYPHLAVNGAHKLANCISKLLSLQLDQGSENFQASNLEVTQLVSSSNSDNVIPAFGFARFNIRFNDLWTLESLKARIAESLPKDPDIELDWVDGASESFLLPEPKLATTLQEIIKKTTGISARLDTGGGTSDARFIKNYCPVVEFGLCGGLMHKPNENVPLPELEALTKVYTELLQIV